MAGEGAPTWEEVARSYGRFLYTVAYRLTGNREDAEDLVQEVLLRVTSSQVGAPSPAITNDGRGGPVPPGYPWAGGGTSLVALRSRSANRASSSARLIVTCSFGSFAAAGAEGGVAASSSRSLTPFLNSREASPRERASLGSRVVPNNSRTMTRMMISSVGPRFISPPGYW